MAQPPMINDHGVVLTVGVLSASDRMALVMPLCTDDASMTDINRCEDAVTAFITSIMTPLKNCLHDACEVTFVQGEGMVDGIIPSRTDFASGTHVGGLGTGALPSNVTGLITFYENPADVGAGKRMRTAHSFMPGPAADHVVGDKPNAALVTAYDTLASDLVLGWASALVPAKKWYRVLSAPWILTANPTPPPAMKRIRPRGTSVPRVSAWGARGYVSTQRRRLIPHQ